MRFDEVLTMEPPTTPEGMRTVVSALLSAEDIPEGEKGAFDIGYVLGLMYGLMDEKSKTATELMLRMRESEELYGL